MLLTIISRLFDPIVVFCFMMGMVLSQSSMASDVRIKFIIIFFGFMIFPPMALLLWSIRTKRISNWDISNRKQRVKALSTFIIFLLVDLVIVYFFGNPKILQLFLIFSFWFIGFFLLTLFWKISGHVSASTIAILLLIRWFGMQWWPTVFIIPMLMIVRVVRKNHSPAQVIAGFFYSCILFLALILFHLV